jgi:RNA polymerase sigma-70 factor (ECF subfamily)
MEPQSDTRTLIEKAQRGDRDAFQVLLEAHRDSLDRYVRLRRGAHFLQHVEVEDVLQETITRAFEAIGRFEWRGNGSFLRWMKGIAERVILKLAQRRRRDVLYLDRDLSARDVSPSKAMRREERFDRFQDALDSLSPDYREVVDLARLQGLGIKEIARRMNRSPKAVAHLVSRALQKLKKAIGETESFSLPPRAIGRGADHDVQPAE